MRFWRLVIADGSSGGVLAVLVAVLLTLQGFVSTASAAPVAVSRYGGFIHCITGRADVAGENSGSPLLHRAHARFYRGEVHLAVLPARVVVAEAVRFTSVQLCVRGTAPTLPRRTRLISEPRAPPTPA